MIDADKIEKATRDYIIKNDFFAKYDKSPCYDIEFGYKDGAYWAIKEFIKDLWHPASEEPKFGKGRLLVLINGGLSILNVGFVLDQLRNLHNIYGIEGWLYLDDLLPKEGCEQ